MGGFSRWCFDLLVARGYKRIQFWRQVMDRRNLLVGLVVLAISAFALAGTASAHGTLKGAGTEGEGSCTVKSLPSFIAQGEFVPAGRIIVM